MDVLFGWSLTFCQIPGMVGIVSMAGKPDSCQLVRVNSRDGTVLSGLDPLVLRFLKGK